MRKSLEKTVPFLFGISNFVFFNSIGQLILVELAAVVCFLFAKITFQKSLQLPASKEIRWIFRLGYCWLTAQLISDYLRSASRIDSAKSIAQIVVLLILLYWVFAWLIASQTRMRYYLVGYAISSIPRYFLLPGIYDHADPWKFVFGPSITLLVTLLIPQLRVPQSLRVSLIGFLASIHLFLGSRSLAVITLLTMFTLFRNQNHRKFELRIFLGLAVSIISVFLFADIYGNLAANGTLGDRQQAKYLQQKNAGPLILTGRSELLYELNAIKETGLLGLGSNPDLSTKILNSVAVDEYRFGVRHDATTSYLGYRANNKIPNHSMIFTSWLEGGILAALFWFYILLTGIKWFGRISGKDLPFGLAANYLGINFFWALLFSPLGAGSRVILAFTLGLMYVQQRGKQLDQS